MTWVRVAGNYINLDLVSRCEVQDKAGEKSINVYSVAGTLVTFKGIYADELIKFLDDATEKIGPQESPPKEPTKWVPFEELERRKQQGS